MASDEINELASVLRDEGYEVVASALLAEFDGTAASEDDGNEEKLLPRDRSELERAVEFLRLRLVEPARKLAEAERLAAVLADRQSLRIVFGDAEISADGLRTQEAAAGDQRVADELDTALMLFLPAGPVA